MYSKNEIKDKVKYLKWTIFAISLVLFFILIIGIVSKKIIVFDNYIYKFISSFITNNVTLLMKIITQFGSIILLNLICLGLVIFAKNKKYGIYAFINLLIISALNICLKYIFVRPRPQIFPIIIESGFSFPSGHSMVSMAFYSFLIYIINKKIKNKYTKGLYFILLSMLILLIGISRIYLGVHFPSDVIGGFCFSISYIILYTYIVEKFELLK